MFKEEKEIKYGNAFNLITGVGAVCLNNIFEFFKGSFSKAWEAEPFAIKQAVLNETSFKEILKQRKEIDPEKEWEKIKNKGARAITRNSSDYPRLLKEIYIPPALLYYIGDIRFLNDNSSVAVVGTRRASEYGLNASFNLSRDLTLNGINIISGLALGIDAKAHQGCLEAGGKTCAVLGSGILEIQPKTNLWIADKIIKSGGVVVSEYSPFLKAEKWTFPQRNRIVAGLSRLAIIVEAPAKSGALITAKFALDMNRDVGVVPGEITSIMSRGSNNLLKYGAFPILKAEDALEILGVKNNSDFAVQYFFDEDEKRIIENINESVSINELFDKTGIDLKTLNQKITMLEIKGAVECLSGQVKVLKRKPL